VTPTGRPPGADRAAPDGGDEVATARLADWRVLTEDTGEEH